MSKKITAKERYQNLPESTKKKMAWATGKELIPNSEIFVEGSRHANDLVKSRIKKHNLLDDVCTICGLTEWQNSPIMLELDHINGINNDNRIENLRFLCPNCHSQTDTYRGRNINTGNMKVTDEELLTAYKECTNIRQTLIAVGLSPRGANYARVQKLL